MKSAFLGLLLGLGFLQVSAQQKPLIDPLASVRLQDTMIEFGIISMQDSLIRTIEFKSTGKVPFHFYDGVSECGCATILLPKGEFKRGKKGKITVIFKSPYLGSVEKKITLVSNAGFHYLHYRAYVKE